MNYATYMYGFEGRTMLEACGLLREDRRGQEGAYRNENAICPPSQLAPHYGQVGRAGRRKRISPTQEHTRSLIFTSVALPRPGFLSIRFASGNRGALAQVGHGRRFGSVGQSTSTLPVASRNGCSAESEGEGELRQVREKLARLALILEQDWG